MNSISSSIYNLSFSRKPEENMKSFYTNIGCKRFDEIGTLLNVNKIICALKGIIDVPSIDSLEFHKSLSTLVSAVAHLSKKYFKINQIEYISRAYRLSINLYENKGKLGLTTDLKRKSIVILTISLVAFAIFYCYCPVFPKISSLLIGEVSTLKDKFAKIETPCKTIAILNLLNASVESTLKGIKLELGEIYTKIASSYLYAENLYCAHNHIKSFFYLREGYKILTT